MNYEYLEKWVNENRKLNLVYKEILRFEDQYLFKFRKQHKGLHICLSVECFCFFSERQELPWQEQKELNLFNQNLSHARLEESSIFHSDRIIVLHFSHTDIYNQKSQLKLVLELIPRYQNMILIKDDLIVDCLRKISFAENRHRQVLPGLTYTAPATEFELNVKQLDYPITIKGKNFTAAKEGYTDMNTAFEALYYNVFLAQRNDRLRSHKIKKVQKEIRKKEKKLSKLEAELADSQKENIWKQQAELLKANFADIKPGMQSLTVANYYQEDFPDVSVKLDETKTAQQNIEYYFKKYRKARDGKKKIAQQIEVTQDEIEKLQKDIFELEDTDFIHVSQMKKTRKNAIAKSSFKKLIIDENWMIFIGRTSRENDELTTRIAKPHDWWFHTRIFKGTHVILRNINKKELPEKLKLFCCRLAAYYSKAKKSSNVPVDYTQIRYVRKPKGAAPGYVTYKNQKTLFVDPLSLRAAANNIAARKL